MKALVADITEIKCDAIMNAANGRGPMGAGVAGAIRRAGGRSVQDDAIRVCKNHGWFKEGDCYVSAPGELAKSGVKAIYHAVTMDLPGGRTSLDTVSKALRNALERAVTDGVKRIAVPGLGTGVGALPKKSVALAMVRTAKGYSGKIEVVFADIDDEFIEYVNEAIEREERNNEERTGQNGTRAGSKDLGADAHKVGT
jgi:O-acetyl-ADP-ribose deacetylase (regulator of RNase III)